MPDRAPAPRRPVGRPPRYVPEVRACRRPACRRPFTAERSALVYCSAACGDAHRAERHAPRPRYAA